MQFFLDQFIGDGTADEKGENPIRPGTADGAWSMLDMRADTKQQAGFCLVGAEAGAGILDFGDDLAERVSNNRIRNLGNRLKVTLEETSLRGIIAELLILNGKEDGSRWRPLKQNIFKRHRIRLGGVIVYDAPVIQGTIIGDTMVEGSNTDITLHDATGPDAWGASWDVTGPDSLTIVAARDIAQAPGNKNNARARAIADLASDDHYAEHVITVYGSNSAAGMGPMVRYATAADSAYVFHIRERTGDEFRLFKIVTGSFTQLAAATVANGTLPVTERLEVNGSDLEGFEDTVSKVTATDTTFTGQVRCGILGSRASEEDDFEAADLGAAATSLVVPRKPLRAMIGR